MNHEELNKLIRSRFARNADIPKQLGITKRRYDLIAMDAKKGDQTAIDTIAKWAMEATPTTYSQEEWNVIRAKTKAKYGGAITAIERNEKPRRKNPQFDELIKRLLP